MKSIYRSSFQVIMTAFFLCSCSPQTIEESDQEIFEGDVESETIEECDQEIFEGDVRLETQEQVNNFGASCYTTINGNLYIVRDLFEHVEGEDVSDLSPLLKLESVSGKIQIQSNNTLKNLHGLENITSASEIIIGNLFNLETLDGIENLIQNVITSNKNDFSIGLGFCPKIKTIDIFQGLTSLDNLSIGNLESLESFKGLNDLKTVNKTLYFFGLFPSMNSLNNLDNLSSVGEEFYFSYTEDFSSFSGLERLKTVGERVFIEHNKNLVSLEGLEFLSPVSFVQIIDNPSLTTIQGLNFTESASLKVNENGSLADLSGMKFSESSIMSIEIENCNSLIDLKGLEGLTQIGVFSILDSSNLENLSGLENVNVVTNAVVIENNDSLKDYCALTTLFNNNGPDRLWRVGSNLFNPSFNDMQSGNCKN